MNYMGKTDIDIEALSKLEAEAIGIGSEARAVCIVHGIVESPVGLRDVAFMCAARNSFVALLEKAKRLETLDSLMRWAAGPRQYVWCVDTDNWYAMDGEAFHSAETPEELAAALGIGGSAPAGRQGE